MFEEKLNKIIESIELQNPLSPETNRVVEDADSVNLSFADLKLLAGIYTDLLPEEVKAFADTLFNSLNEFSNPKLSVNEKNEKEAEIYEWLEHGKNSIAYLNSLNRVLIADNYEQTLLEQLNRSYGFPVYQGPEDPIRGHYIEKLAETYIQGNNSGTIQYLLKRKNNTFLESLDFIEDVRIAIKLTKRERLKKKMQFLDEFESFDLPESEIKAAIIQSERERLKEVMRKIDAGEESKVKHLSVAEDLPEYKKTKPSANIVPIGMNKFAWKRLAVAASVIGLIAIVTVLVYNKKTSSGIARNKPPASDTNSIRKRDQEKNNAIASSNWDTVETILTVRKEGGMGFAVKQEKITVQIYKLKEKIPGLPGSEKQNDSLKKLNKTYTFKSNNLSVYLPDHDLPELYKIDNKYYLKITETLYNIRTSDKPTMLEKVTDRNILTRIDKINFQLDDK